MCVMLDGSGHGCQGAWIALTKPMSSDGPTRRRLSLRCILNSKRVKRAASQEALKGHSSDEVILLPNEVSATCPEVSQDAGAAMAANGQT